ncbi:hypothetical protein PMAYCL1PPCAC_15636, partial [Pristionchus mayeri]
LHHLLRSSLVSDERSAQHSQLSCGRQTKTDYYLRIADSLGEHSALLGSLRFLACLVANVGWDSWDPAVFDPLIVHENASEEAHACRV